MSIGYGNKKVYNSVSEITGPTGWYMINVGGKANPFYVNQDYDGGGWVLVMANRRYTAGMNMLKWNDAMYSVNYRHGGTDDATNLLGIGKLNAALSDFNAWVGLSHWLPLSGRKTANKISIVQYSADSQTVELSDTLSHRERMLWNADSFNPITGAMVGAANGVLEVNTSGLGNSGFYTYSVSGYKLTTFDKDQDNNGGNCSTYYNNNPWFYSSCWSGNMFAGGSYRDAPFWVGATNGSGDREYSAVYIK